MYIVIIKGWHRPKMQANSPGYSTRRILVREALVQRMAVIPVSVKKTFLWIRRQVVSSTFKIPNQELNCCFCCWT